MGNKTRLDREQRGWLQEQMEDALYAGTPSESSALAEAVGARLLRWARDGDGWAQGLLESLALDGAEQRAYAFLKRDRTVIPVPTPAKRSGSPPAATKATPSRAGNPARDEGGSVYWQQKLWWEMTWEEFGLLLDRLDTQARRIGERRRGLAAVLVLRDRHPATATPGEALALEGIDPRAIGLNELTG